MAEWKSLTDEEADELFEDGLGFEKPREFVRAIEAALRAKNSVPTVVIEAPTGYPVEWSNDDEAELDRVLAEHLRPSVRKEIICDGDFPEGFGPETGIPAQALRAANAAMFDVIGKREWDVPQTAAHILAFWKNIMDEKLNSLKMPEAVAWLIKDRAINSLQVESIQKLIDRCRHAHMIDIKLRINGKDEWHEADWIKHLMRLNPNSPFPDSPESTVRSLIAERDALRADAERLRNELNQLQPKYWLTKAAYEDCEVRLTEEVRDAERYRHVRDNIRDLHSAVFRGATPLMYKGQRLPTAAEIDAAIDAARSTK